MEGVEDLIAILVNMNDYNIGADAGGQVSMFDDFDIDYNAHKYLIETRVSGALAAEVGSGGPQGLGQPDQCGPQHPGL